MITRRHFMGTAATGVCALAHSPLLAQAQAKKINILYIMSDDHAAHAISAYGSKINKTPHMDRLAQEGALCDHVFVTNSICAPSRACIVTGMHSCNNGTPVFNPLNTKIKTIGGFMRDAGYFTAILGKWHLHSNPRMEDWDQWLIYPGQGAYYNPVMYNAQKRTTFKGEYASEHITKITKTAVEDAEKTNKPFFIMMHHKAPHRNWLPSPKYKKIFRSKTLEDIPMPTTLFDDYEGRASPIKNTAMTLERHMRPNLDLKLWEYFSEGGKFPGVDGSKYTKKDRNLWPIELRDKPDAAPAERERLRRERIKLSYLRYMQDYLACVQSVDDSVGDMLDFLKAKGMDKNTLIIYTSDQGFFLGDHGLYDKRFMMEESIKMPFLARCPDLIPAGTVNHDIITNVDFPALFTDVAGIAKPSQFQGRSFLPCLQGKTPADWQKSFYYRYYIQGDEHNTPAHYGVRTRKYKLIYYYINDEWECFDLVKDPDEVNNVYKAPAYREIVKALKVELYRLKAQIGDSDQFYNSNSSNPNPPSPKAAIL